MGPRRHLYPLFVYQVSFSPARPPERLQVLLYREGWRTVCLRCGLSLHACELAETPEERSVATSSNSKGSRRRSVIT